jgi:nucleoside phosphorylase
MRIHYAIFGEQNNGHALLGASGDSAFATKLTVLTDRPGDPPVGADWGPVVSGFELDGHYVFLRMQPDPSGRRAGMVRTYAAYVQLANLSAINNLLALFHKLPSGLGTPLTLIDPLEVPDSDLAAKPSLEGAGGRFAIARLLCAPESKVPLLWSSSRPYLPTLAALWSQFLPNLRAAFSFRFLFAPEHYTETVPTLVITLPDIAGRWPTAPIVNPDELVAIAPTPAQSWLAGSTDTVQFEDTLRHFAMDPPQFQNLSLISSFSDTLNRLSRVGFAEARKAVNIVARFSRVTDVSKPYRSQLFMRLCTLTRSGTANDLLLLRNLQDSFLIDLIPDLQQAMRDSLDSRSVRGPLGESDLRALQDAATEPSHWWSAPFISWLQTAAAKADTDGVRFLVDLAGSPEVLEIATQSLPTTGQVETQILEKLPATLGRPVADNIAAICVRRAWMRLHASCLARSRASTEAIANHIAVAGKSTEGFPILKSILGFDVLVNVACTNGAPSLVTFVGDCISRDSLKYLARFPEACEHYRRILQAATVVGTGPLTGDLRTKIVTALEDTANLDASFADLSATCATRDGSLVVDLSQPKQFIEHLPDGIREQVDRVFEVWLRTELQAGHTVAIRDITAFKEWFGARPITEWLDAVPVADAVQTGVNAFRCMSFLTDSDFKEWLIRLFTRTQYQRLGKAGASALSDFLSTFNFPESAQVVRETALHFYRSDVLPVHEAIRYKYQMAGTYQRDSKSTLSQLPTILLVTALTLERSEIIKCLPTTTYDHGRRADYATWPADNPRYQMYVITTGPGNLTVQSAIHRILDAGVRPHIALFVGVCGGVKDSEIGDVVYSTKVYSYEGAKEEDDGLKARPMLKETSEELVQLAHRVAAKPWWRVPEVKTSPTPKASAAVFAAGEILFASTSASASNYQHLKKSYNDTQVVDQEAYGFLKATQDAGVSLSMVLRGVSDKIDKKEESDSRGNQPLAAENATAFLFALLDTCRPLLEHKSHKKSGFINLFFGAE